MNKRSGHIIIKLFLLTMAVFGMVGGIYLVLMQVTKSVECNENLVRIYQALELYEMDRGSLPRLAFYPDEPMTDPDSIRVVLEEYGVAPSAWVCPSSYPLIANLGLSYIWNIQLNGSNLRSYSEKQWMLIEINALSEDVPAPHFGRYNVLYTDGSIERISHPLQTLKGL